MTLAALCLVCLSFGSNASVLGTDGKMHQPLREGHGRATAFVFVAHDCPLCNAYAPEIERIAKSFSGQVDVQLVYSEPSIDLALANSHAREYGLGNLTRWLDPSRRFAARCGATIVPQVVVYSVKGLKIWTGRIDDQYASLGVRNSSVKTHDLRDALADLSQGKRPRPAKGQPVGCYILPPENP